MSIDARHGKADPAIMTTPNQIAREAWTKIMRYYSIQIADGTGIEHIQSAIEEATEQIRKDRDLWKAQAEFESEHREKYRQRLMERATEPERGLRDYHDDPKPEPAATEPLTAGEQAALSQRHGQDEERYIGEKEAGKQGTHRRIKGEAKPTGRQYGSVEDLMHGEGVSEQVQDAVKRGDSATPKDSASKAARGQEWTKETVEKLFKGEFKYPSKICGFYRIAAAHNATLPVGEQWTVTGSGDCYPVPAATEPRKATWETRNPITLEPLKRNAAPRGEHGAERPAPIPGEWLAVQSSNPKYPHEWDVKEGGRSGYSVIGDGFITEDQAKEIALRHNLTQRHGEDAERDDIPAKHVEPVEVDEWHPASEPPTPEDFEPTAYVLIRTTIGGYLVVDSSDYGNNVTHWRKITPPK